MSTVGNMANKEHFKLIKMGSGVWNAWRRENPRVTPDLDESNLMGAQLVGANLSSANLRGTVFQFAALRKADLYGATLYRADLGRADLREADLRLAKLGGANLHMADLGGANLLASDLGGAFLDGADLRGANFERTLLQGTSFGDNDLSETTGLENALHVGPSTIGVSTLYRSDGNIPVKFLRGVGVPEDLITFIPSLVGRAIEFYSCFISYSHRDEEFSQRLHARMRNENLRVWYAPEDMKGGRKLHEEIFSAIQVHDKLLLVLSESSMKSEWVMTEIRRAKKVELEEKRRKLFPIRLVDFEAIQKWECFDADSGKDLAVEVREYYIPDFSNWRDHDAFEKEFVKLLRDLKAAEG